MADLLLGPRGLPSISTVRMVLERALLEQENTQYKVFFDEGNLRKFTAFVFGPDDSLYRHKLLKLRIEIPANYPSEPPEVTFTQHSSGYVHPSIGIDGLVHLSVPNTWPVRPLPWNAEVELHIMLLLIRGTLDNEPYRYKPNCPPSNNRDYNRLVQYTTWRTLLLDNLKHETSEPIRRFLKAFIRKRSMGILKDVFAEWGANADIPLFCSPDFSCIMTPEYETLGSEASI
ncbi:hypothetical protein ONZ43_g7828 [Nemania bipapillata]|uniref:Uncharacterized protein n=1 Tax=Nemania bipapillata TaxID=110536 RepID=A0ACC2HNQ5_9PEZI|nr:hypothetical protein ONZ43_g7828 [Nemania bipapillata]